MKHIKTIVMVLVIVLIFGKSAHASSISNIPSILAAPVILYDEANNILSDGNYMIRISLSDYLGTSLYLEEQEVTVNNGVAHITIGQGYAVGSDLVSSAGGLSWKIFATQGDITVKIMVEGQTNSQEVTVLGSQPYSFIAQQALSVSDDAITSDKIKDGTITEADLDEGLLEKIERAGSGSSSSSSNESSGTNLVDSKDVSVSTSISLNNASGSSVYEVLQGLDTSIDVLRDTHLSQGLSSIQADVNVINTTLSNLDDTYATESEVSNSINDFSLTLDSNYATDQQLSAEVSTLKTSIGDNLIAINGLDTSVGNLEVESARPVKAFAYGSYSSITGCSGYNIDSNKTMNYLSGGGCYFIMAPTSANYHVVTTRYAEGATTPISICHLHHKEAKAFSVYCQSISGATLNPTYEFVVYYNN